jgi:DNA-binding NtrC family response regulator
MIGVWQLILSFFTDIPNRRWGERPCERRRLQEPDRDPAWLRRVPIVALVGSEEREVLTSVSVRHQWDVYFVQSCEDARALSNQLSAPVILFDRDWPDTEWRVAVQNLASASHRACVVLTSRVVDDSLWEELFRQGGYDVLAKPLRADDVTRVIKLALSYWRSGAMSLREPKQSRRIGS